MPKRDDPSTPTKENPGKDGSGSPLSKHKAKRLFHGGTAMDVDPSASDKERANQQAKERDERRKRIELQKKTGVKTTGKNKGEPPALTTKLPTTNAPKAMTNLPSLRNQDVAAPH